MLKGYIDSLVIAFDLTDDILPKLSTIGVIVEVKNGILLDQELLQEFKTIKHARFYDYLALLYTSRGLQYEMSKQIISKHCHLSFNGLWQYTEVSKLMREDLQEVINLIRQDNFTLSRLDIAFDSNKPFNVSKIAIKLKRVQKPYRNTCYLKTPKEGRTNKYLNIRHYEKFKDLYRLEFSFGKRYLTGRSDEVENRCARVVKKALGKAFKFMECFT